MKMQLYTILDTVKVETGMILQFKNENEALRSYESMMNNIDPKKTMATPEDFTFLHIGEYDTETGHIKQKRIKVAKPNLGEPDGQSL